MVTSKPTILSWEKGPQGCLREGFAIKAPLWQLPSFGNDIQDDALAVLGEVHAPLLANGQLDCVVCLIVGCCHGASGVMAAPGVQQGDAFVLAVFLRPSSPSTLPSLWCYCMRLFMIYTPLGRDFFFLMSEYEHMVVFLYGQNV